MLKIPGLKERSKGSYYLLVAEITVAIIFTIYLIAVSFSQPVLQRSEITTAVFNQSSVYEYDAVLKPNTLYEKSTLNKSDGYLYTSIVDLLRFRYRYTFESDYDSNANALYTMNVFLISMDTNKEGVVLWQKKLPLQDSAEIKFRSDKASFAREYNINVTEVNNLTKTIEKEINVRGDHYLKISSDVFVKTQTNGYTLDDQLPHELMIKMGNTLDSEGESANRTKSITKSTEKQTVVSVLGIGITVLTARYLSLGMLIFSLLLIAYGASKFKFNFKLLPKIPGTAESINKKYRSWIIETRNPSLPKDSIQVTSIEDLVKLSDDVGKPVLHSFNEDSHIYYIIDDNAGYFFKLSETDVRPGHVSS